MKNLKVALLAALLLTPPVGARADLDLKTTPPDGVATTTATLADVLSINAKAAGKPLRSFPTRIEEWSMSGGGFESTSRTAWSGKDYKTVEHRGPFVEEYGSIGGVRWEQNVNGILVIMGGLHQETEHFDTAMESAGAGSPGDAVKLLGEVTVPIPAYVVEVRPGGDPPTWLFFDKSSGLLVRKESVFDGIRTTYTYKDFSSIDGAVVAHSVFETNGDTASDTTSSLTSLKLNVPVPASELNLPATRADLVQFPAGAKSVQLPVSMPLSTNTRVVMDKDYTLPSNAFKSHIVVRVVINGRGLDLALDSGASGILIDSDVASELGLKRYGTMGQTLEGQADRSRLIIPEMRIGDLVMKNVAAYGVRFNMRPSDTEKVVGLLGFDFIASVGLKVDWDKREVTAYPAGTIPMPDTAITLPIKLDDLVPNISVSVGDVASDHFLLDTGAGGMYLPVLVGNNYLPMLTGGITVFPEFAAAHASELRDQGLGHETQILLPFIAMGVVGGYVKAYPVQVKQVVFGVPFSEFIVVVVDPQSHWGGQDMDGLVGYAFLHYFNLYFDYQNSRILLEPNDQFRKAKHVPQR
jgi:predicted aspartyl protease